MTNNVFLKKKIAEPVMLLIAASGLTTAFILYPALPETVPIHFDLSGKPTNFATKDVMMMIQCGSYLFLSFVFFSIKWLNRHAGDELINLPNKDYWLAPERREQTFERLYAFCCWIGSLTLLLLIFLFTTINSKVSQNHDTHISPIYLPIGIYLFLIIFLIVFHYRSFRKPDESTTSEVT